VAVKAGEDSKQMKYATRDQLRRLGAAPTNGSDAPYLTQVFNLS